jgi:hypothetical protein
MTRPRQLKLFPPERRTYVVSLYGYGEASFEAASRGKARAMAYRQFCDAVARKDFHWFLVNSRVWRVAS